MSRRLWVPKAWKSKQITADEAAAMIRSYQRVGMGVAPGDPPTLQRALLARRGELEGVQVGPLNGYAEIIEDYCSAESVGHFEIWTEYVFDYHRQGMRLRTIDMAPPQLGLFKRMGLPGRNNLHANDVYMVRISPPDAHGYCSFGTAIWHGRYAIREAKLVIAEIDPTYIRTYGENFVHESEIDYWVESDMSGIQSELGQASARQSEICDVIGANAATLVNDGDTIQIGGGSASAGLYQHLAYKNDLGFHSEVAEDMLVELVNSGSVNNRYKTIDRDRSVAAWYRGTPRVLREVEMNPLYELRALDYVDNPKVCAQIDNFVAVNSCLSVDLTGQIAAESFGHEMYGGPGGQTELMTGALLSEGGRNIICCPSTALGDSISRIVTALPEGTVVTTPRHFVDFLVTEYGVAELFGQTLRRRATNIIRVAHPSFRGQLREDASRLYGSIPELD
jgi:4-hydroxybutyrate CoA-transferase